MGLPYSYRKFYPTEISASKFSRKLKKNSINNKLSNISESQNTIFFDYNSGLFGIKTKTNIIFTTDKSGFYYEFSLINLIKFIILMIIVMAFVVNEIRNLIIIPSISIILIYSLTIFHIKSKLEIVFDEITKDFTEPEKLSVIQKKWLENPNICPACGTDLIIYDSFCPECGLNLSKHRKFEQEPCSRTGFYNSRITYKYKKNTQKM